MNEEIARGDCVHVEQALANERVSNVERLGIGGLPRVGVVRTGSQDERVEFVRGLWAEQRAVQSPWAVLLAKDDAKGMLPRGEMKAEESSLDAHARVDVDALATVGIKE